MTILGVRSVPLTRQTANAWRENGIRFLRRSREPDEALQFINNYECILNLGNSQLTALSDSVWNKSDVIRILKSPSRVREVFDEVLPPYQTEGDVWVKGRGRAGVNKRRYRHASIDPSLFARDVDVQRHVDGEEYRCITVGARLVQVNRRLGDNSARTYEWVGLSNSPGYLKDFVRGLVPRLPRAGERTVVGWDIVVTPEEEVFMFEGNTCPGVNDATAERIVREIRRQIEESR